MARLDRNRADQLVDFFDRLGGYENEDEREMARDVAVDIELIDEGWDEFCDNELREIGNGNHDNIWEVM